MRASQVNMAVAQSTKPKSASKSTNNAASKQKAQMHRRSRTGSFQSIFIGYRSLIVLSGRLIPALSHLLISTIYVASLFICFHAPLAHLFIRVSKISIANMNSFGRLLHMQATPEEV